MKVEPLWIQLSGVAFLSGCRRSLVYVTNETKYVIGTKWRRREREEQCISNLASGWVCERKGACETGRAREKDESVSELTTYNMCEYWIQSKYVAIYKSEPWKIENPVAHYTCIVYMLQLLNSMLFIICSPLLLRNLYSDTVLVRMPTNVDYQNGRIVCVYVCKCFDCVGVVRIGLIQS